MSSVRNKEGLSVALNGKGIYLSFAIFVLSIVSAHIVSAQDATRPSGDGQTSSTRLNEALELVYTSQDVVEDTLRVVEMLTAMAEQGDVDAKIALGDLYLYGTLLSPDWDKALKLYTSAADAGNGRGLYNYGTMLMWEKRDASLAESTLTRAGELGVSEAWATLAEGAMYGYLGDDSTAPAKFDSFAERGAAEGVNRIAVLDATRHLQGVLVEQNGPRALEILEHAADQGNAEALRFLVRLLRDGEGSIIGADRPRALALLETHRPLLSEVEFGQMQLTIDAASSNTTSEFAQLAQQLNERPSMITVDFVRDLMAANVEALTFLLQNNLGAPVQQEAPTETNAALNDNPLFRGAATPANEGMLDYLLNSPDHTILVHAMQVAGLVETFQGSDPLTIFAPTDAAFDALPDGTVEALLMEENRDALTKLLTSHIVAEKISAVQLASRARASRDRFYHFKAISGAALSAQVRPSGDIYIFDENSDAYLVSVAGIASSDSTIHVVDGVLMPR